MLMARMQDFVAPQVPAPMPRFEGCNWWSILRVMPSREVKAAERLKVGGLHVYLPTYSRQVRRRGKAHCHRLYAAVTGMLFVPDEMLDIPRRRELFDFAGVHGFMHVGANVARLTKSDIELVRKMEARLNLPPECKGVEFKVGQKVSFTDPLYAYSWVGGAIFEIVDSTRIGVEVGGLFGCTVRVYVPASEIEVM